MEQQTPPNEPVEESIFSEEDYSMEGYDKHVRNARIGLYVLAGLMLLTIFAVDDKDELSGKITIGLIVFLAGIYALLGYWSKKRPFTAILIGLILFVSLQVLNAIADPSTLLKGWYIRIGIPIYFILGLRNAKDIQDRRKAFGK